MMKWYEDPESQEAVLVSGRVRLERNIAGLPFPSRLSADQAEELVKESEHRLLPLLKTQDAGYTFSRLDKMTQGLRGSYREKKILNESLTRITRPSALIINESETGSIILNGEDHFRLQSFGRGQDLAKIYDRVNELDDLVNKEYDYAFDDKYGYLTSFPTNTGTGMRAGVLLHLYTISSNPPFRRMVMEMARFGITVRGIYSEENMGSLYEVCNHKTLGQSEKEIIDLVNRVSMQLSGQEKRVRESILKTKRLEKTDEVYKSYGILRYAKRLSLKEAMMYLSTLRFGVCEGVVHLKTPVNLFGLMMGVQPMNLQQYGGDTQDWPAVRAAYIQARLPELTD